MVVTRYIEINQLRSGQGQGVNSSGKRGEDGLNVAKAAQVSRSYACPFSSFSFLVFRWEAFRRYCSDGQLAIDNNLAERALRPCAIGRKNWMFLGSDNGGRTAAILYSFTATAKAIHLDPQAYLRHLFTELPALPPNADLAEYLPHHHLALHPNSHRPTRR